MDEIIIKNVAFPHSQAQLQFARANAQTKNCNRACLFANTFLPTRFCPSGQLGKPPHK